MKVDTDVGGGLPVDAGIILDVLRDSRYLGGLLVGNEEHHLVREEAFTQGIEHRLRVLRSLLTDDDDFLRGPEGNV